MLSVEGQVQVLEERSVGEIAHLNLYGVGSGTLWPELRAESQADVA